LSHLQHFRDGTVLVKEQQGLRFDIFRSYTLANDTEGAIKALRKYGPEEPQLYGAALAYLTSSPRVLQEAGNEVDAVLKKIDEEGLMAPLQVIQTLSVNGVATMGLVKKYLRDSVGKEREEIANVSLRRLSVHKYPQTHRIIESPHHHNFPLRYSIQARRARGNYHKASCLHSNSLLCLRIHS